VLPIVIELAEGVHALGVNLDLKVGLGTDVVVGGDLNGIRSMSRCQGKD